MCVCADGQSGGPLLPEPPGGHVYFSLSPGSADLPLDKSHLLTLSSLYLLGQENGPADALRRRFPSSVMMCLAPGVFCSIQSRYSHPWLDLCTTEENAFLSHFCCQVPSSRMWVVDALVVPWPPGFLYCFAPLHLLPRIVQKVVQDQAEVLLVARAWSQRPWFPCLLCLSVSPNWVLPVLPSPLHLPLLPLDTLSRLKLAVWHLNSSSS